MVLPARLRPSVRMFRRFIQSAAIACAAGAATLSLQAGYGRADERPGARVANDERTFDGVIRRNADRMIAEGRRIFRFDTFGDEAFWGGELRLHEAIEGARFGGV